MSDGVGNPHFENWPEANIILDPFVDQHFGIYLARPLPAEGFITFLPEEKLAELIPPEQAPKLNDLAKAFTTTATIILNKYNVLEEVSDQMSELEQEAEIKRRFDKFFIDYKNDTGDDFKDVLKHFLGCPVILKFNQ